MNFRRKNRSAVLTFLALILYASFGVLACQKEKFQTEIISLEGTWYYALDSLNTGLQENWQNRDFNKTLELPGTLDEASVGVPGPLMDGDREYVFSHLARKHYYVGPAWYQKEVEIPEDWSNKQITLTLERVLWESRVWIGGREIGTRESLVAPHRYDLTEALSPGKHIITLRIDNSNKYPGINVRGSSYELESSKELAHAYTNHTQIKWNGVIGDLQLEAKEFLNIKDIQVYPDAAERAIRVGVDIENQTGEVIQGEIKAGIVDFDGSILGSRHIPFKAEGDSTRITFTYKLPGEVRLWDEFSPDLYSLNLSLIPYDSGVETGIVSTRFGLRNIERAGDELRLNGHRLFLRGTLECSIFPLTGRPPMTKDGWMKLIETAKAYGLNHFRFHSWNPPKAAFEAADEAGFYLQVELPLWNLNVGEDLKARKFLEAEAGRMLSEYGNHPSFVMMALGNELQGDLDYMNDFVRSLKEQDDRHLYATTSFSFQEGAGKVPQPEDDFYITQYTEKGWVRGQGIFNAEPPSFDKDYTEASKHLDVPLISHEIGQYSVYPDISEIEKYTGVLHPQNFIAVREDLKSKGMLNLADDFLKATAEFAELLYKEEIERALKTPEFDGFQLLQLQDFPGQGTALVGLLNAFWESKGATTAEEFRQFSGPLVPLVRFEKAVYTNDETFKAEVEIANFFKELTDAEITWQIRNEDGTILKRQDMETITLPIGNAIHAGSISYPLEEIRRSRKLTLQVGVKGTSFKNQWNIWVYPKEIESNAGNVLVTQSFTEAQEALKDGKSVLLNPPTDQIDGIKGRFVPVFWSPVHFPDQPGTMGLLMDPEHPVFNTFPTEFHSDWNWWDLAIRSKSLETDPENADILVRVIDNFVRNSHLSNLFEAKVGEGKLIFSAIDLHSSLNDRPAARQLKYSILNYMNSKTFEPGKTMELSELAEYKKSRYVMSE